jgi:predicted GNAT family acetyltransferase
MKDATAITIINNENDQRFEASIKGATAFVQYRHYKGDIAFMHTSVPQALEGQGIASQLAVHALEYARQHRLPVMVYCPFIAGYIKKHPEYKVLLDKKYYP